MFFSSCISVPYFFHMPSTPSHFTTPRILHQALRHHQLSLGSGLLVKEPCSGNNNSMSAAVPGDLILCFTLYSSLPSPHSVPFHSWREPTVREVTGGSEAETERVEWWEAGRIYPSIGLLLTTLIIASYQIINNNYFSAAIILDIKTEPKARIWE